jgi:ABC-type sugar transport system ATPase subunit
LVSLSLNGVSKSFKERQAVADFSLEVGDGEFCSLLGPSGCGKSTLLRIIAGLEFPDSGDVIFDGKSVLSQPAKERDVGMVFQGNALFPLMTVAQNIGFPLKVRGEGENRVNERVAEVAELLRIGRRLEAKPGELSGGEQQRVALARAIVRHPRIFLMDEPLSSLDAPLRAEMRIELRRLHQKLQVTTIYVTHDQAEALALADRVGVMDSGKLLQYETPDRIYSEPANSFVAHFVGNYSTNLIPGAFESGHDGVHFVAAGLRAHLPRGSEGRVRALVGDNGVLISVRPEDISLSMQPVPEGVEGTIGLVESMGQTNLIELAAGEQTLRVVTSSNGDPHRGQKMWMSWKWERVRFFDKISGLKVG